MTHVNHFKDPEAAKGTLEQSAICIGNQSSASAARFAQFPGSKNDAALSDLGRSGYTIHAWQRIAMRSMSALALWTLAWIVEERIV